MLTGRQDGALEDSDASTPYPQGHSQVRRWRGLGAGSIRYSLKSRAIRALAILRNSANKSRAPGP